MPKKRSSKSAELEERIAKAVIAIKEKKVKSAYAAAKEFDVNRGTLMNRLRGGVSHAKGHESTQLLSSAEEKALIAWCKHVAAGGSPARHQLVREMAWEILTRRVASVNTDGMQLVNMPSLGKDWVKRFILRHPEVKTTISAKIDVARWKDSTPESIHEWFDAFNDTCRKFRYNNKNIYNMDETGFSIGTSQCNRVIIDSTLRTRYKVEPGRQEWVSVLECICADGTSLAPLLIMKAENVNTSWINPNTPDSWQWAASSKGWTSNKHGLEWLRRVFEPGTREKAGGKQRLLICDGHDSHITGNFIAHCIDYKITLLIMPPHTSHLTQPADVAVFGPLATFHGQETDRLTCNGVRRISKAEWVEIYTIAREKAFTSKNIEAAWRGAGLVPLDRSKVLRHIPAAAMPPNTPHKPLQQAPLIFGSSPPDRELLREQNATFNQKVSAVQLSVRTQKYARDLTAATEQLAAQVRILRRSNETKEEILSNRVERKSGKRKALKGHFLVSTVELRDAVFAAEEETAKKKAAKRPPKRKAPTKQPPRAAKRKRPATPSESSEESSEEYSSEESDISECIALE